MDKNLNNNINDKDHFNVNDDEDNEDLDDDDDDDEICDYDNDDYDDEQFVDDDDLINLHDQDIQIDDDDDDDNDKRKNDLEYFDYYCTTYQDAKNILNEIISNITNRLKLNYSLAKLLLIQCKWDANEILDKFFMNDNQYFFDKGIITIDKNLKQLLEQTMITTKLIKSNIESSSKITKTSCCNVCLENKLSSQFISLICEHFYCIDCWFNYCRIQIDNRQSILKMTCMNCECKLLLPEDFVHFILQQKQQQSAIDFSPIIKELTQKYDEHLLRESIDSFNRMRLCINNDCKTVLIAQEKCAPKRVTCKNCNNSFCFQCGNQYHAPTDCKTIILWYRKCADDSETAHYIRGHTKLCPNCNSCIEKNGGCNHMSCYSCKHEFCWVCLGQWSIHGPQYFKCSKYKENPDIQNESERAREALKKYLFYYERWDNHMKSLELEDENRKRIQEKIDNELNRNNGTWIDWQYLLRGAKILSKCRYTLQYTYPYAYYMQSGSQKELFEYQQAALENEIENLAWKIENADTTDRGALENQMTIVEKRRTTLLYNFFQY